METRVFTFINRKYELTEYGDLTKLAYDEVRIQKYKNIVNVLHRHNNTKIIKPRYG